MNKNPSGYVYLRPPTNKGSMGAGGCLKWDSVTIGAENEDSSNGNRPYKLNIDVSHVHAFSGTTESNDGSETRPANHTIRIWKRIA